MLRVLLLLAANAFGFASGTGSSTLALAGDEPQSPTARLPLPDSAYITCGTWCAFGGEGKRIAVRQTDTIVRVVVEAEVSNEYRPPVVSGNAVLPLEEYRYLLDSLEDLGLFLPDSEFPEIVHPTLLVRDGVGFAFSLRCWRNGRVLERSDRYGEGQRANPFTRAHALLDRRGGWTATSTEVWRGPDTSAAILTLSRAPRPPGRAPLYYRIASEGNAREVMRNTLDYLGRRELRWAQEPPKWTPGGLPSLQDAVRIARGLGRAAIPEVLASLRSRNAGVRYAALVVVEEVLADSGLAYARPCLRDSWPRIRDRAADYLARHNPGQ